MHIRISSSTIVFFDYGALEAMMLLGVICTLSSVIRSHICESLSQEFNVFCTLRRNSIVFRSTVGSRNDARYGEDHHCALSSESRSIDSIDQSNCVSHYAVCLLDNDAR
ncbi:hypothetical protein AVEN_177875-1 [Araneus ventricosus]|uniref:Uncharacterized protein n=1 Tax=Araneus ventricosus TaxID=182803 RepID=A0A4Y2QCK0_ARAVE|nr:hypothetical protein AVEN_177875-1 [Araneus ventricosus]